MSTRCTGCSTPCTWASASRSAPASRSSKTWPTQYIETVIYCQPLHQQFHYIQQGCKRGQFPLVERIADRAVALPFHTHLEADHVKFIVKTMKDSSLNVGAGAAIY